MTAPGDTSEGHGHHLPLAHLHKALEAAYAEALTDPRNQPEGIDGAACGPHVKHLAELAAAEAARGVSSEQWRADMLAHGGPKAGPALDTAETCMRESGLWPWNA